MVEASPEDQAAAIQLQAAIWAVGLEVDRLRRRLLAEVTSFHGGTTVLVDGAPAIILGETFDLVAWLRMKTTHLCLSGSLHQAVTDLYREAQTDPHLSLAYSVRHARTEKQE